MARMFNPPHPGLTLRDDVLPALGLSVTQASEQMALRIEAWLGKDRGGDAQVWLAEQTAYDMWQTEQRLKDTPLKVQRAPKVQAAA